MNNVYTDKKFGETLHVREVVALHPHMNVGEALHLIKCEMAEKLARTIMESDTYFTSRSDNHYGTPHVEYNIDCVVMTINDYRALQRDAFSRGVDHAAGMSYIKGY